MEKFSMPLKIATREKLFVRIKRTGAVFTKYIFIEIAKLISKIAPVANTCKIVRKFESLCKLLIAL